MASSNAREVHILTIVAAVALVLTIMLTASGQSHAATGPKIIRGWVWDNMGNNVTDASIVVSIWEDASKSVLVASDGEQTDEEGWYSLWFAPEDWEIGYFIDVVSTFHGDQENESTTATAALYQYVNITYPYEIPEFDSEIGFVLAGGAIGAVALVTLFATQRKSTKP